jgi:hypothetical protein
MAAIPTTQVTRAGADIQAALQAATAADTLTADGEVWLRVQNLGASPCVVTVTPPAGTGPGGTTIAPLALAAVPITTGDRMFGPFPPNPFADAAGNVNLTYSSISSVKVCALRFTG